MYRQPSFEELGVFESVFIVGVETRQINCVYITCLIAHNQKS